MSAREPTHREIIARIEAVEHRLEPMADMLERNTEKTEKMAEILEAYGAIKGFGNFLIWCGKIIAALSVILASALAVIKWQLWRALGGGS